MVATPEQIGFVRQEWRTVVASDSAVKTKYGDRARDTKDEVIETFFDSITDAQAVANARLAFLKADRRRFRQKARGAYEMTGDLDFSQVTPTVQVVDEERDADLAAAVVGVQVDLGGDNTTFHSWG